MICEKCGTQLGEGAVFCSECGNKLSTEAAPETETVENAEVTTTEIPTEETIELKPTKNRKGLVLKIVAAVLVLALLAGGGFLAYKLFSGGSSAGELNLAEHPVFYEKDDEVLLKLLNKDEAYTVADIGEDAYFEDTYLQVTNDGSRVFFAADIKGGEFDLYYRETAHKEPKGKDADEYGIKIASGVTQFTIDPNGQFVVYKKSDRLYFSDLKEEVSLESNIREYYLTKDAAKLVYITQNGETYSIYERGLGIEDESVKIADNVEYYLNNITKNNDMLYYKIDSQIHFVKLGEESVNTGSSTFLDDYAALQVGDTVYTADLRTFEYSIASLFDDDCIDADYEMEEPRYIIAPWTTPEQDRKREAAWEAYSAKLERDKVRDYYWENTADRIYCAISTFKDGKLEFGFGEYKYINLETCIIENYDNTNAFEFEKIKMSSITDFDEAQEMVKALLPNPEETNYSLITAEYGIIPLGKLKIESTYNAMKSPDEKYLYTVENSGGGYLGTLYRYDITASGITNQTKLATDVSNFEIQEDGTVFYFGSETLGVYNGGEAKQISDNAQTYDWTYIDGVLYYIENYSMERGDGTLMKYIVADDEAEEIDIDVFSYIARGADVCYYIKDFDSNDQYGDLYLYKNGESEQIDEEVERLIY